MTSRPFKHILSCALLALTSACSHQHPIEGDLGFVGAPDWVNKGSRVLLEGNRRMFYGVGSAPPMGDLSFQINTAGNRARSAIAQELSAFVDYGNRDLSHLDRLAEHSTSQFTVEQLIKTGTAQQLSGARLLGQWRDPATSVVFILVGLDLEEAKGLLREVATPGATPWWEHGETMFDRYVHARASGPAVETKP